ASISFGRIGRDLQPKAFEQTPGNYHSRCTTLFEDTVWLSSFPMDSLIYEMDTNVYPIQPRYYELTQTGIKQKPQIPVVTVFPNPFEEVLEIHAEKPGIASAGMKIVLYDALGLQVYTTELQNTSEKIHPGTLMPGLYILC